MSYESEKIKEINDPPSVYHLGLHSKNEEYSNFLQNILEKLSIKEIEKEESVYNPLYYTVSAGLYWPYFDYIRAFKFLKKYSKKYLIDAVMKWKNKEFNWKEALEIIKDNKPLYKEALMIWPPGIEDVENFIKKMRKHSQKFPNKPYKLKESIEEFNYDKYSTEHIYYAGIHGINPESDPINKNFNWIEAFKNLVKRADEDYKGLHSIYNTREFILMAGRDWKDFNKQIALKILKDSGEKELASEGKRYWGPDIPETLKTINKMKKYSQKFPSKPYKLKEDTQDLSSMTSKDIYLAGTYWKQFDYEKGLDALIQKNENGNYIYLAGIAWPQFDYEKGLDALIEKDKTGYYIYYAGKDWPKFNYEKGLDTLIKKDKTGNYIYLAGIKWPQFDYEKGFKVLKKFPEYYEAALERWPKGIKETQKIIDELKKRSKKFPSKPLRLKEDTETISSMTVDHIYWAGRDWPKFNYEKGLDALIQKDETGECIYWAGKHWKQFNYEKGLNALIQKDKTGEWIYYAGIYWKQFNYEKGFNNLIKKDKTSELIHLAGIYWKQFDYEKGLDALIEKDKTGNYIYLAGIKWPQFDYEKGFKVLKKFPEYYERALKRWPKGIKETQKIIDELKKRSKKFENKPYKLKEEKLWSTII